MSCQIASCYMNSTFYICYHSLQSNKPSNCINDVTFCDVTASQSKNITLSQHHSIQAWWCYNHNMVISQHHHVTTSPCHNITVSQNNHITSPPCHHIIMSQHNYNQAWWVFNHSMIMTQHCDVINITMSQQHNVTTTQCHNQNNIIRY